jgi:predicted ATPase
MSAALAARRLGITRSAVPPFWRIAGAGAVRDLRGCGGSSAATALRKLGTTSYVSAPAVGGGQVRAFSVAGGGDPALNDVRKLLNDAFDSNPAAFGSFAEDGEMDVATFQKLVEIVIPSMGKEESKALFMSMDTSMDNKIQSEEIFSDVTMAILRNRMSQMVGHPLEGSYHCLPRPPFHSDPKQLQAIETLRNVYDEVVVAHSQPIPVVSPPQKPKEDAAGPSLGMFASMFGGVRKTKPAPAKTKAAELLPPKPNAPKGAFLYGGCGCGKTVLLDLFFRSLPEGFTARRLHWHEFIRDAFRSMQGQPPGENIFEAMADMLSKQFRVLLLDELLITHISEAILVKNLFRQLWARGMTIITTSNYRPEELYAKGFNRDQFVDFIPDLASQCPMIDLGHDKDYRRIDATGSEDLFWSTITAETTISFNKAFEDSVSGNMTKDFQLAIPMEKRSITVPAYGTDVRGAKVAKFSFHDLCVKNMGRADYSVIAENYHTIFVEGVPKFKADLGAEFRRFISLTDILYGKKVELRLQSEVHTEQLFADGLMSTDIDMDELMGFRRCSSMLSEMQNQKYQHMVWLMRNHMLQETALKL